MGAKTQVSAKRIDDCKAHKVLALHQVLSNGYKPFALPLGFVFWDLFSAVSAALMLFFIIYTVYSTVLHITGRHERCRFSTILLAALATPSLLVAGQPHPPYLTALMQPLQMAFLSTLLIGGLLLPFFWIYAKNNEEYSISRDKMNLRQPRRLEIIGYSEEKASDRECLETIAPSVIVQNPVLPSLDGPYAGTEGYTQSLENRLVSRASDPKRHPQTIAGTSTEVSSVAERNSNIEAARPLTAWKQAIPATPSRQRGKTAADSPPQKIEKVVEQPAYSKGPPKMPKVRDIVKNPYYGPEISRRVSRIMKKGFKYKGKIYQHNRFLLKIQDIDVIWRIAEDGKAPKISDRQLRRLKKIGVIEMRAAEKDVGMRPMATRKCRAVKYAITLAATEIVKKMRKQESPSSWSTS